MECFHCGQPARVSAGFAAVLCKDHMKKMPYIITIYVGERNMPKAIVVGDALFCGGLQAQPSRSRCQRSFSSTH